MSGVQRYGREVLREIDDLISEGQPLTRGLALELLVPPGVTSMPRLNAIGVREIGGRGGHMWEQRVLPRHVKGGLLSLCNTGPVRLRRQIVCIHDVNTRACPYSYSRAFRALYRVLLPALGRHAARVATVSAYSAEQLVRYGIASRHKLMIAPNGHEHATRWQAAHSSATLPLADGRTVVAIGSPAPHKNIARLLAIADDLARSGIRLAIVGMRDSRVFGACAAHDKADSVVWLGRLCDDEIAALLRDALCLAFPSYAEGFGLPAVEAMVWGCPVIASDRSSLPEICGDAALYASPDDPHSWRDQIMRLACNVTLRDELVARGHRQAARFRWRAAAVRYLEAMAEIDGRSVSAEQSLPGAPEYGVVEV